jgi:septal ring factor EnvC (AmiA/AmiB activator)
MYLEREAYISVSVGEDLTKIREVEQREQQLQAVVNGLTAENLELKQRLQRLEQKLSEIEKALQDVAK